MTETEVRRWFELRAIFRNGGSTPEELAEYELLDAQLRAIEVRLGEAAARPEKGVGA